MHSDKFCCRKACLNETDFLKECHTGRRATDLEAAEFKYRHGNYDIDVIKRRRGAANCGHQMVSMDGTSIFISSGLYLFKLVALNLSLPGS